jgi:glyoxylase-like metal-dependent hydrolase (beta-lactamase superfamily II)
LNAPLPTPLLFPHPDAPGSARLTEVATGVFWLRMPLPFALDHINLWLLRDWIDGVDGWTLIDTGFGNAATREIWDAHFADTMQGLPLLRVIVTHYHPDHIGNAAWLLERVRGQKIVWTTQGEFATALLIWTETINRMPEFATFFASHGMPVAAADAQGSRGNIYKLGVPDLPRNYRRLISGDNVRIGGRDWRVIVGMGHAPEHASLFCASPQLGQPVLIAGDMLLPRISTNVSVGAAEPDADPLSLFLSSIAVFTRLPEDTLVLPSHGLPFIGIKPRVAALTEHHRARLSELEDAAATKESVTAYDLLPVLFRRPLDVQQQFFAMGESIAHLNHLWHQRRLDRSIGTDHVIRFTSPQE